MSFGLGAFALACPVGQGGMAEVWRGEHSASGRPVAVKILTHVRADDPRYLLAFGAEVRAVASLRHPHIVSVYDHGILPEASDLPRSLVAGLPWLAMEWIDGGTLADRMGKVTWSETLPIVRSLLGALAHAHARGVIHRDIKPSNILVRKDGALRLSDFGIAHALDAEVTLDTPTKAVGTPSFMAPEQVHGDLRAIGPWTDLYAVGCLLYALLRGEKPFHGRTPILIARAQLTEPVLAPAMPLDVPPAYRAILERLLEKEPARRYPSAATVLHDLESIEPATRTSEGHRPPAPSRNHELRSAGLGLFGLRHPPFVGREEPRDRLWRMFNEATDKRKLTCAIVSGPAGVGKSRLAQWVAEQASEQRGATVLSAMHGPIPGHADGLQGMISRYFRSENLERREGMHQIARRLSWLGLGDARNVTNLAAALWGNDPRSGKEIPPLVALLSQWTFGPLVIWLDDVQWGSDALQLAQRLVSSQLDIPALVVLTVRDDVTADADLDVALRSLGAERVVLDRLADSDQESMVRSMLGLEDGLVDQIVHRTEGNPLFAIHLLRDWIERGELLPGPKGYRLAHPAARLPEAVEDVWRSRLDSLFKDRRVDDAVALELAATLGASVDQAEWEAAKTRLGLVASPELVDDLVRAHLAVQDGKERWAFVHGMLRDAIVDRASAEGRARVLHQACAHVLRDRPGADLRVGRHLLAAGESEAALVVLALSLGEASVQRRHDDLSLRVELYQEALLRLDVPAQDPRWIRHHLAAACVATEGGKIVEADKLSRAAEKLARHAGDKSGLCGAVVAQARIAGRQDDNGRALRLLLEAQRLALESQSSWRDWIPLLLSGLYSSLGDFESAETEIARIQLAALERDPWLQAAHLAQSATLAFHRGRLQEARVGIDRLRRMYRSLGAYSQIGFTYRLLGDIERVHGDRDEAERLYQEAHRIYRSSPSSSNVVTVLTSFALLDIARGKWEAAMERLEAALSVAARNQCSALAIHATMLAPAAALGRWNVFDHHLSHARGLVDPIRFVHPDIAGTLELAGRLARHRGDANRARAAFSLAGAQWLAMADERHAEEVAEMALQALKPDGPTISLY